MDLLHHLLAADPAAPRLTFYDETHGTRMDFSAQTVDNWVAKIANMLEEELELSAADDAAVALDLPAGWQAAVITLGALATGIPYSFISPAETSGDDATRYDAVFTSPDKYEAYASTSGAGDAEGGIADRAIVLVTADAFGRGVAELGEEVPPGAIDFSPTVRFYGDQYFGPTQPLPELVDTRGATAQRVLSLGWDSTNGFADAVLRPLASGGSVVVVTGMASLERLASIARDEKVDIRLG